MLKENQDYQLTFPNGKVVQAKMIQEQTYPSTGMSPDYHFEYLSNSDISIEPNPVLGQKVFSLPAFLIPSTDIKELNSDGFAQTDKSISTNNLTEKNKTLNDISVHYATTFDNRYNDIKDNDMDEEQLDLLESVLTNRIKKLEELR